MKSLGLFLILVGILFATIIVLQPASAPLRLFSSPDTNAITAFFVSVAIALTGAMLLQWKMWHQTTPSQQVVTK